MKPQTNVVGKKQNIIISVNGLINSGKSRVIQYIQKARPHLRIFLEDVENWVFLEPFYKNPKEYALLFQLDLLTPFRAREKYEFVISAQTLIDSRSLFAQCLNQDEILS
jgi:deoxyadenosine/deoxycytidine kinase